MVAKRVVIWRHGQTAYNLEGRIQGHTDIALDEVGRAQAAQGAAELAALAPAIIVSSDLSRARATAQGLADLTGLGVQEDVRLRERTFGQWEGLNLAQLKATWPKEYAEWRAGEDIPSVGMETRLHAAARIAAAVRDAAALAPDDSVAVVVTHGGCSVCGVTELLGLDPGAWWGLRVMRNAHWAIIEPSPNRVPHWRLVGWDLGSLEGRPGMNLGG